MWDSDRLLILLDFDGTLVPIAGTPDTIQLPPEVPGILQSLIDAGHEVYLVTGRDTKFIREKMPQVDIPVVGLHGIQWPNEPEPIVHPAIPQAISDLKQIESEYPGTFLEDKGACVSFHWRQLDPSLVSEVEEKVRKLMGKAARIALPREGRDPSEPLGPAVNSDPSVDGSICPRDDSLSILPGHMMLELRPAHASKAHAAKRLMDRHPGLRVMMIGDDVTDEEAMAVLPDNAITIRVAEDPNIETPAGQIIPDVDAVLAYLKEIYSSAK